MQRLFPMKYPHQTNDSDLTMTVSSSIVGSSSDPNVFGPPFWFVLHNAAVTYPVAPTSFVKNGMIQLLSNLPLIVPCIYCREHFYTFITHANLNKAVESRESLFDFFVTIHNYVNKRYGKNEMSLQQAKTLYGYDNPNGSNVRITYV